jgi:hypothetical protein
MPTLHSVSARMFDYFDAGIMEGLQHRLVNMTEVQTQGNIGSAANNTVSLHSKVCSVLCQCESLDEEAHIFACLILLEHCQLQHVQHMLVTRSTGVE